MKFKKITALACALAIILCGITVMGVGINEQCVASDNKSDVSFTSNITAASYTAEKSARHRLLMNIQTTESDSGVTVKVYKNYTYVWTQYVCSADSGKVDVRMLMNAGDVMLVTFDADEGCTATVEYDYTISTYDGSLPVNETFQNRGYTFEVSESKKLTDYVANAKTNGSRIYAVYNGCEYDMKYSSSRNYWEVNVLNGIDGSLGECYAFVYPTYVKLGWISTSPCIDVPVEKDGLVHISGSVPGIVGWMTENDVTEDEDGNSTVGYYTQNYAGVCTSLYKNGEMIWSSRVGSSSVRYDEEYDTSYFSEYMDVVEEVKEGDVLTFSFDQWRRSYKDSRGACFTADISDIKIDYVSGDPISKTTKKKLDNSIVFDIYSKQAAANGETKDVGIVYRDRKPYLRVSDATSLFGSVTGVTSFKQDGVKYQDLLQTIEKAGMLTVEYGENKLIAYKGISGQFSYSELSQLSVGLCDDAIVTTDGSKVDLKNLPKSVRVNVKLSDAVKENINGYVYIVGRKEGGLVYAKPVPVTVTKGDYVVSLATDIECTAELDEMKVYVWTSDMVPMASVSGI